MDIPEFEGRNEDYVIVLGGLLVAIAGGIATQAGIVTNSLIRLISLIILLTAPISIYSGKRLWGGEVARNMEFVALGLLAVIINRIPQILLMDEKLVFLGMGHSFWTGFLNFLGAVGFSLVSYGFYRFWKLAKVEG